LTDSTWQTETRTRLARDADRLDALAARAGWSLVGGTNLFRTYDTGDAMAARAHLARARIWTRAFPYSTGWLRLGLPGDAAGWNRLEQALAGSGQ
jgi:cobalamin biosynthetic protein CobC